MPPVEAHILAALAVELAEAGSVEQTVEQVTAFAAQALRTEHVGITLIRDRGKRFETAGPTSDMVADADEWQDRLREGPCVDAAQDSRMVISNDIENDERWPNWGPRAASLGLDSVLSSEMHAGERRIGALNVYGSGRRAFTREDVEVGQLLAYHASAALRFAHRLEGLTIALDSRTVIGQAQGVLMERFDIDPDRAFAVLRRYSQDQNIRLAEVAREIVTRVRHPQSLDNV